MFSRRSKSQIRRTVHQKPSIDFSLTGLIYTGMMLFMGAAAVHAQVNLLFGVFGLMIGIMIVSGIISRTVLRKLNVRRRVPEFAVVGRPFTIHYVFENQKRFWPTFSVTLSELDGHEAFTRQPQTYLMHAAAGSVANVPADLMPVRRGPYHLNRFQLSTSFPFGFIKRAVDRAVAESVIVHPAIAHVDRGLLARCLSAEHGGSRMRPRRGGHDEFYGIREYRAGENPRMIYWRRSARTGTLVSKEMSQVSPPRLLILLDTCRRAPGGEAQVERAIAMAASLASSALEQEVAVGVLTWSSQWKLIPPNRGKRHHRDLLSLLACLPENTEHGLKALLDQSQRQIRPGTTPIVFSPGPVNGGLDPAHRSWIAIAADSAEADRWFRFADGIDFCNCAPPVQPVRRRKAWHRLAGVLMDR